MTHQRPEPLVTRPTVSVVVPCYNYGHYLRGCVGTILDQHDVDLDVLIIDDASPDGSVAVAHELAAADPRVRVIAHEVNKRHIATYNEGLAAAKGDYVVLLSADDLLAPGALGRATALMERNPDVGLVYGYSPLFDDVPPTARTSVRSWSVWSGPHWLDLVSRRGRNPVATPEVVMRTHLVQQLGGYDARLPHSADFFMWLQAAAHGSIGRVNGADQAFYRVHGANMHRSEAFAGALKDISERERAFALFFDEDGAHVAGREAMLAAARLAMAEELLRHAADAGRGDAEAARPLVDLALRMSPHVRDTRAWARLQRGPADGPVGKVGTLADTLADKVRWRRFRRDGLFR
ncbi:hypothetical protein GCM10009682_31260 [Luedemannella flava]|uniref:Glycosyltransferase 2-like domain-containing protein n=1 Tax=Luedemannella flava TaxID=349316 RepID=A0ABP4YD10_9ACTN